MGTEYKSTKEIKPPCRRWQNSIKTKLNKRWEVQVHLQLWRAIKRSILKLESRRIMRVVSGEDKAFSLDYEVKIGTTAHNGIVEVCLV